MTDTLTSLTNVFGMIEIHFHSSLTFQTLSLIRHAYGLIKTPLPKQQVFPRAWKRCGLNGGLESAVESGKTGGWWISMYSTKGENTFHIRKEAFRAGLKYAHD